MLIGNNPWDNFGRDYIGPDIDKRITVTTGIPTEAPTIDAENEETDMGDVYMDILKATPETVLDELLVEAHAQIELLKAQNAKLIGIIDRLA